MTGIRRRAILAAGTLVLAVGLPLAGWWARRDAGPRCAYDGLPIEARYRVVIVGRDGDRNEFCCVHCAERWVERKRVSPAAALVADEATGEMVDSHATWFVRSGVVTNPVTRNRVHAFRDRAAAEQHAAAFAGEVLDGVARPLQVRSSALPD